jgi:hypothetical protein
MALAQALLGECHKTGKGNHWTAEMRQHLAHCVHNLNLAGADVQAISNIVFTVDKPNLVYLRQVVNAIATMGQAELVTYILGPLRRGGGNDRKLSDPEVHELLALRRLRNQLRLGSLATVFNQRFPIPMLDGISESTVSRTLSRAHVSQKKPTLIAIGADPMAQLAWLDRISHADPLFILDLDEKSASRDNLRNQLAWSHVGAPAPVQQPRIEILGFSFSIISIYTALGFLVWRIYQGSITSLEVEDFLRDDVGPLVDPRHFLVLDNASNHSTLRVRMALEETFQGRWDYCEPYSYNIKPCEKGLSMVTTWLRERSDRCATLQEAIDLIDEGFRVHSVAGERGSRAYNHFSQFSVNHAAYLEDGGV